MLLGGFPTGESFFLAVEAAKTRAFDRHLAAVKADFPLRLSPPVHTAATSAAVSRAAGSLHVVFHHSRQRFDPRRQAEPVEAHAHRRQRFDFHRARQRRCRCDIPLHGVAFLRGIITPSLPAQGEQRRPSFFNKARDIPHGNF